jgi:hypothetical protein
MLGAALLAAAATSNAARDIASTPLNTFTLSGAVHGTLHNAHPGGCIGTIVSLSDLVGSTTGVPGAARWMLTIDASSSGTFKLSPTGAVGAVIEPFTKAGTSPAGGQFVALSGHVTVAATGGSIDVVTKNDANKRMTFRGRSSC